MTDESLRCYLDAQRTRIKELKAEIANIMKETRERVSAEQSIFSTTLTMTSFEVSLWPEWMKSERLKRAEAGLPPEPEPEKEDDTFPCLKCKTGRMVDLGDGRSGYCPDCEATLFI